MRWPTTSPRATSRARAPVDAREGLRRLLPVRTLDHDRRRGRPTRASLALRTWVNGELRQDSRTLDLIFGVPELVAFIRETCTLEPGDLILTGTPSGVGMCFDPPRFLGSGDVVRIEIERLGCDRALDRLTISSDPAKPAVARLRRPDSAHRERKSGSVRLEHPIDQAVLQGLLGREEAVALHVLAHLLLG